MRLDPRRPPKLHEGKNMEIFWNAWHVYCLVAAVFVIVLGIDLAVDRFRAGPRETAVRAAQPRVRLISGSECGGIHHVWIWWYGDWESLLPSLADRILSGQICPKCAGTMLGTTAHIHGLSEDEMQPVLDRLQELMQQRQTAVCGQLPGDKEDG
jgi:hypothetical protein